MEVPGEAIGVSGSEAVGMGEMPLRKAMDVPWRYGQYARTEQRMSTHYIL